MKELFVKSLIPQAHLLNVTIEKGIDCYEYNNSIYVLIDSESIGQLTQQLKGSIAQNLLSFSKPILYFSMFRHRLHFTDSDEIAWGSYVWFADAPKHYIHFEDKPSKINLTSKIETY